ncbi:hypothetical protein RM553_14930 [Zunongwangia sp. F363]|uniref:Lipoprotein n=1 Tax=Autumnicola tepida TaxID=3075595 RepID=A0ABU3CCR9_9FLAO|nr:hypothetical protein [Zunongwangia sp. F363]MDT0644129.1 hypothetical protein [Zunongwangia sp. F363]
MKKTIIILGMLALISCKDKELAQSSEDKVDTTPFGQEIAVTNQQVQLLPEAREYASQWIEYITAQNEIEKFQEASLREVMENSAPLAEIMQSLQTSLPDSLRTNGVEARLNVLTTKSMLLDFAASKRNPDPEEIREISEEIPSEFNNFKIQLNEIFLKTLEDFEKELDDMEEENLKAQKDSTARLQQQNQNQIQQQQ